MTTEQLLAAITALEAELANPVLKPLEETE